MLINQLKVLVPNLTKLELIVKEIKTNLQLEDLGLAFVSNVVCHRDHLTVDLKSMNRQLLAGLQMQILEVPIYSQSYLGSIEGKQTYLQIHWIDSSLEKKAENLSHFFLSRRSIKNYQLGSDMFKYLKDFFIISSASHIHGRRHIQPWRFERERQHPYAWMRDLSKKIVTDPRLKNNKLVI